MQSFEKNNLLAQVESRSEDKLRMFIDAANQIAPVGYDDKKNLCLAAITTGTKDSDAALLLLNQLANSLPTMSDGQINGAIGLLRGLSPSGELEAMITTQMVSTHNLAMAFANRAAKLGTTPDHIIERDLNRATKLMKIFTNQAETLHKLRHGGQQVVQVQHVNIREGGQAVIGNVNEKDRG